MKTTFYCVDINFYDTNEVKACMTERQAEIKPNNQFRRVYGLTAFKIWTPRKKAADKMAEYLLNGKINIDDVIYIFETTSLLEKNNQNNKAFRNWLNRGAA